MTASPAQHYIKARLVQCRRLQAEQGGAKLSVPQFPEWLDRVTPAFNWHWDYLQYVQSYLDRVTRGEIKRLMLFLPPRHGKSEMTTVRYPIWRLERDPSLRVIVGAYNQILANKFSRKARRIAQGRLNLASDRYAVEDWETTSGGGLRAVGVGGGITGQGGNLIIIDDPVKSRDEADSEAYRERVWEWYTDDLYTRLEPGGSIILIMTRWHDDDLAGRILASETASDWTVVNLPAIAGEHDPLGREEGAALNPERYDVSALSNIKRTLGSRSFTSLYQQSPTAIEGAMFKRAWWQRWYELPHLTKVRIYVDSAFKTGVANDYSAVAVWATDGLGSYYLLDFYKEKYEYPALMQFLHDRHAKYTRMFGPFVGIVPMVIEDKANGQSAIQTLSIPMPTFEQGVLPALPVIPFPAPGDVRQHELAQLSKEARAESVTPLVEARRVYIPGDTNAHPWVEDYITVHEKFPAVAHDEEVDLTSMALIDLSGDEATSVAFGENFLSNYRG